MELNIEQLCELLSAFDQTSISELTLKNADFELTVRKGLSPDRPVSPLDPHLVTTVPNLGLNPHPPGRLPLPEVEVFPDLETGTPSDHPSPLPPQTDPKWVEIVSPMVGTFYRAPAPDEPPFVDVGDRVGVGQTVCIIEAMKLMNEIEAEIGGRIVEILVQNAEPVEYGQPLMRISPD